MIIAMNQVVAQKKTILTIEEIRSEIVSQEKVLCH